MAANRVAVHKAAVKSELIRLIEGPGGVDRQTMFGQKLEEFKNVDMVRLSTQGLEFLCQVLKERPLVSNRYSGTLPTTHSIAT